MNPDALRVVAMEVAREAGSLIRDANGEAQHIEIKSGALDLVTDTDRAALHRWQRHVTAIVNYVNEVIA